MSSELFIFARFHAKEGLQEAVAATIHEVIGPTRQEPGCLWSDHDVNRKYGPWLVKPERLYEAMKTIDKTALKMRGLIE